jgi:hypothetical protein
VGEVQPLGTTRAWTNEDQVTGKFLGGRGGEVGADITLPDGIVFRVPAGKALVIQPHFLNATNQVLQGRSYLDVKFAPASPDRKVAGLFGVGALKLEVPPGVVEKEMTCTLQKDIQVIMQANHMHESGRSAVTTLVINGVQTTIKDDPVWNYEWATNPNFTRYTLDHPFIMPAGSTITTHCQWDNQTGHTKMFPEEMCGFATIDVSDHDYGCVEGQWLNL